MRRSSSSEAMEAEATVAQDGEDDEASIRERVGTELAYYSQSPGGSSGTITLPAPQGWTQADLEHATAIGNHSLVLTPKFKPLNLPNIWTWWQNWFL